MDDVSFSLGHLYSVSGFFSLAIEDGNDINKRPPMIYYFIIEDLSKHYLQKKLHMPAKTAAFIPRFLDIILRSKGCAYRA